MDFPSTTTIPSSSAAASAPPKSLLVRYIKAHVQKGDRARQNAERNREKSEEHYLAAGQYLITLKAAYAPSWQHWEAILKVKVGLSTGRASELMQLADGRKDLQEIRDATAQRVKQLRARGSSLQSQCNEEDDPPDEPAEDRQITLDMLCEITPNLLIDALSQSTPGTRNEAVTAVVGGERQTEFERVRDAVADLYVHLAKAGR
jgi:hypothetical protein